MNVITLRSGKILVEPEIIKKEKKSAIEGAIKGNEPFVETLRKEENGTKEPFVEVLV